MAIKTKESEALTVFREVQENILDDWFNFEDASVGIHWVWQMNDTIVEDLNDEETDTRVESYSQNRVTIVCDSKYRFEIELVERAVSKNEIELKWEIVSYKRL